MLQEQFALALELFCRLATLAQVPDRIYLDAAESRAQWLAHNLDGNWAARRPLQRRLPALTSRTLSLSVCHKLGNVLAPQLAQRAVEQLCC